MNGKGDSVRCSESISNASIDESPSVTIAESRNSQFDSISYVNHVVSSMNSTVRLHLLLGVTFKSRIWRASCDTHRSNNFQCLPPADNVFLSGRALSSDRKSVFRRTLTHSGWLQFF